LSASFSSQVLHLTYKRLELVTLVNSVTKAPVLLSNFRLAWKKIVRYKHSSLLYSTIGDEEKMFCIIANRTFVEAGTHFYFLVPFV